MKRENLEEATTIVNRINRIEAAIGLYDSTKKDEFSWGRLFVNFFKTDKSAEFAIGYNYDNYIRVSEKQQEELATLLRKWLEEDKQALEKL